MFEIIGMITVAYFVLGFLGYTVAFVFDHEGVRASALRAFREHDLVDLLGYPFFLVMNWPMLTYEAIKDIQWRKK